MTDAVATPPIVTVYSTISCPYCTAAKEYLTSKGIKFTDHNVEKDGQKAAEMMKKSYQNNVPVIDINGTIIIGFNKNSIDLALNKKPIQKGTKVPNLLFDPFG